MYSKEDFSVSPKHKHHCRLGCTWYLGKGKKLWGVILLFFFFFFFFLHVPYVKYLLKKQHENHQVTTFYFLCLWLESPELHILAKIMSEND